MTMQEFFIGATRKAAADLVEALNRLPEDKRNWKPSAEARSAADMVAEVAILNGTTAETVVNKAMPDFDFAGFSSAKAALAQDTYALHALLNAGTEKFIAAIQGVSDDQLTLEVMLPWGPMTLAQIVAYPYWNMSYHEGQINYIASLLS